MAVPLEEFVRRLEESGIVSGDTMREFIPPMASPKGAEELALALVKNKKITKYQAAVVYNGNAKSLVLGNYILLEKIGAGGMGQVFKARHQRMDRIVAIKLLTPTTSKDPDAIARFEREVRAAAKLIHPNIVAAHDADCADGFHFLVMEYIEGRDLAAIVKKEGTLPIEKAVDYILQAATGLEAAHKKGIVHRDIKPSNLLVDADGTVKILDMGLAILKMEEENSDVPPDDLTTVGKIMGTVDFMSPEQALNTHTVDNRTDIYALGCTLYYILTGKAMYSGNSPMEKLMAHRLRPIPLLSAARADVPPQLETVFRKMVAKKVGDRYQSATELIAALRELGGSPAPSKTVKASNSSIHDDFPDLNLDDLTAEDVFELKPPGSSKNFKKNQNSKPPSGKVASPTSPGKTPSVAGKGKSSKSLSTKGRDKTAPSAGSRWQIALIASCVVAILTVTAGFMILRPSTPLAQSGLAADGQGADDPTDTSSVSSPSTPKSNVKRVGSDKVYKLDSKTKVHHAEE